MAHVLFRTAAGTGIGLGHVARCSALAAALRRRGHTVSGLVRGDGVTAFERRGVPSRSATGGAEEVVAAAERSGARVVVFDDYEFPERLVEVTVAGSAAGSLVLDDGEGRTTAADAIWNGGPWGERGRYRARRGMCLLGLRYALLRAVEGGVPRRRYDAPIRRALVSAGGGGATPLSRAAVRVLRQSLPRDASIAVVHGTFASVESEDPADEGVDVIRTDDLYPEMLRSDLAVSAAGQTALELAMTGTPSVLVPVAANQRRIAEGLDECGAAIAAGDPGQPGFYERLEAAVRALVTDAAVRARLGAAGRAAVDGAGTDRVADALERLMEERSA